MTKEGLRPIRVLVCDDSTFMRKAISRMLNSDPDIEVVDTAANGMECLDKAAALGPDVVTLDVMMPGLDGLGVLKEIMERDPRPVIMLSSLTTEGAEISLSALEEGAVDIVDKPATFTNMDVFRIAPELLVKVKAAAGVNVRRTAEASSAARSTAESGTAVPVAPRVDLVVIGASTGGPPALQRILGQLPSAAALPIVVVQHMPDGFTSALAGRLDDRCLLAVKEAEDGDMLLAGRVLIARSGMHLRFEPRRAGVVVVRLDMTAPDVRTPHRPSIDVVMRSAAEVFPGRCLGVLLTGMGSDGAEGMVALAESGSPTIAEAESSAVIYGMPRAAIEAGGAAEVLDLPAICDRIAAEVFAG